MLMTWSIMRLSCCLLDDDNYMMIKLDDEILCCCVWNLKTCPEFPWVMLVWSLVNVVWFSLCHVILRFCLKLIYNVEHTVPCRCCCFFWSSHFVWMWIDTMNHTAVFKPYHFQIFMFVLGCCWMVLLYRYHAVCLYFCLWWMHDDDKLDAYALLTHPA